MVVGSIEERIKKMKQAILTQAKQRSHMIVENANEEADQERARLYNAEKEKIQHEFALLTKNQKIKAKIQKSALHNKHRIARMQARYKVVERLKTQVEGKLKEYVRNEATYRDLLRNFIVQGMLRLMETNINVQVKKDDNNLVKELFSSCEKQFTEIMKKQTGRDMQSKLEISTYDLEEKHCNIIGGVFLRSNEGVIVCDNSIDSRVRLIFEQLLPHIRGMLFPKA